MIQKAETQDYVELAVLALAHVVDVVRIAFDLRLEDFANERESRSLRRQVVEGNYFCAPPFKGYREESIVGAKVQNSQTFAICRNLEDFQELLAP